MRSSLSRLGIEALKGAYNLDATRWGKEVFNRDAHSTAMQTQPYPIRHPQMERNEHISTAPNRNGATHWIPPLDRSS
mgnify:FL=1